MQKVNPVKMPPRRPRARSAVGCGEPVAGYLGKPADAAVDTRHPLQDRDGALLLARKQAPILGTAPDVQTEIGKQPWSRADKINRWIAVLALMAAIIALAPYVQHGIAWLRRPSATITTPTNGSIFYTNHKRGAGGIARHIPLNSDLWLVLRSGVEGRWYPVARISIHNGPWTVQSKFITPAVGPQELALILVPITDDAQFIDYVDRKYQTGADPGISSLPPLGVLETICQINVQN